MSDDDCDIFSMPKKRVNGLPKQMFIPDTETSETEFSFIETKPAIKKSAKGAKAKKATKDKPNKTKPDQKDQKKTKNVESTETEQAPPTRELSPVSILIQDMEKKQAEQLPIARRTRASLGKREASPKKSAKVVKSPAPTQSKRKSRGRKKKTTEATPVEQEIVDLVKDYKAPFLEAYVNLDSDEEKNQAPPRISPTDFEDENPEIDITLSWQGEVQMYKLRRHQKFAHMFKEISERHNVPIEDIVISRDDQFIQQTDSPESVGIKVYHLLNGYVVKSNNNHIKPREDLTARPKSKMFQLKVQGDKWKKSLIISMKKTEPFKILYIKCAEEIECDVKDLKLYFDGELLELDDTPKNQDMEGNEIIDLKMK